MQIGLTNVRTLFVSLLAIEIFAEWFCLSKTAVEDIHASFALRSAVWEGVNRVSNSFETHNFGRDFTEVLILKRTSDPPFVNPN